MNGNQLMLDLVDGKHTLWHVTKKTDDSCRQLADRHYSRQTIGAANFCRPGNNYVLRTLEGNAVWVSWYSKYRDDKFNAIECTLFRNESVYLSSELILLASLMTFKHFGENAPQTIITYVKADSVQSTNAGYCYLKAGYTKLDHKSTKGLLTYAITYEDLLNCIQEKIVTSKWFKGIKEQINNINLLHESMNGAFAEYEIEFAIMYASEAAKAYMTLKSQIEKMFNPQFAEATILLEMYCTHFFEESINIEDLYNTLIEWQSVEGTEELQESIILLEGQYRLLNNFVCNGKYTVSTGWTTDVSPHLMNWLSLDEREVIDNTIK